MSQHLIIDFLNRTYVFKPFDDAKIINHKLKKYQGSNRKNNSSPEIIAESTHTLHKIKVKKLKEEQEIPEDEHIDITV